MHSHKVAHTAVTFAFWLADVDKALIRLHGLTSDDLPDYRYRDAFDAGKSPETVAKAAARNAESF